MMAATALKLSMTPSVPVLGEAEFVFEIIEGGKKSSYRMIKDTMRIGRSKDCDILLNHTSISRLHCIFQRQGDQLMVLDNNTRNGTFVNGAKVDGYVEVKSGDRIQVADTMIQFKKFVRKGRSEALARTQVVGNQLAQNHSGVQISTPSRVSAYEVPVSFSKKKIPARIYAYIVVLALMTYLAIQGDKKEEKGDLFSLEAVRRDPAATFKLAETLKDKGSEKYEIQALMKASKELSEKTEGVILNLEANIHKEESNRVLSELTNNNSVAKPRLNFNEKLSMEHFFSGIREYNYQNYIRAESHFQEAMNLNPSLKLQSEEYLASSKNKRRLFALREYKIANRYFASKHYSFAADKFKEAMRLLENDKNAGDDWAKVYENAKLFIGMCDSALGTYNKYGRNTQ